MKIIEPIAVNQADFYAFGSAPYADYGWTHAYDLSRGVTIWSVVTPYAIGAKVISSVDQSIYQATVASTGVEPSSDAAKWTRLYKSNAWRAFDGVVGNPCRGYSNGGAAQTGQNTLIFCLRPSARFDTVALLNVKAKSVTVTYVNPDGGVYSSEVLTVDTSVVVDAWTYWFEDAPDVRNLVFEGLDGWIPSSWADSTRGVLTIEIAYLTAEVSVGEIVIGKSRPIGVTLEGANRRLVDYSEKDVNIYGEATLIRRPYSWQHSYDISIDEGWAGSVSTVIEDLTSTPIVVYPDAEAASQGLIAYGYISDFSETYRLKKVVFANLKIEGLI